MVRNSKTTNEVNTCISYFDTHCSNGLVDLLPVEAGLFMDVDSTTRARLQTNTARYKVSVSYPELTCFTIFRQFTTFEFSTF